VSQKPRPDATRGERAGAIAAQLADVLDRNGVELTVPRYQQLTQIVAAMLAPAATLYPAKAPNADERSAIT
jgi:hypothetical protein